MKKDDTIFHKMIEEVEDYAILMLNKSGYVENWNRGAEKIKGYTAKEIIGKSFRLFYTEEDKRNQKPELLLETARTTGKAAEEGWRLRKDGSAFWGSIVITALHDDEGQVIGFTKVTRDLTERKLAEDRLRAYAQQLERQNKELEQFAYIASHDLQEPLRTVSSFVELIMTKFVPQQDDQVQQYMSYVVDASNRMRDLIKGLLDFSRLGREGKSEAVDCQELVKEVLEDLQVAIQEADAQVQVGPLPVLMGYRLELKLLFQNLIGNALKFRKTEVPAAINIWAKARKEGWEFAVADNGIGIDSMFHDKIFVIFQRLHSRKQYTGAGIGLAHCKKIVELHGGSIWVNSKPNEGTTFHFLLPDKH